jgi:hypothetical protein
MRFKENLLKKIQIDALTKQVLESMGPPGSGMRIDKAVMARLLAMGSYEALKERDLNIYILEGNAEDGRMLVLDNDLAIYQTSAHDIGLRKSPTVKEMVSIRNIKKILNDSDVVLSKKEASVKTIQKECIDMLDLSFEAADIEGIADEGAAALETGDTKGVRESLTLFSELLGYQPAPKPFANDRHEIMGKLGQGDNGEVLLGPVVIYSPSENTLKLIDETIGSFDKAAIESMRQVAAGLGDAAFEGSDAFQYLKDAVLRAKDRHASPPI